MSEPNPFSELIRRVRAGDERAAEELVHKYEPLIRREVRLRLSDHRLERVFDSMDVCQSVLASFFVRTAAGQYEMDRPEQLVRLLVRMARNKLASAAREQHRQRRDVRRVAPDGADALRGVVGDTPSPSRCVAGKELLEQFRAALSDEERRLADLRAEGHAWAEIAARLGGTPEARRAQLSRAVGRAAKALGLDEDDHDDLA
jgi:RNA polymerase sigma-70 factor (ECF subfamily)